MNRLRSFLLLGLLAAYRLAGQESVEAAPIELHTAQTDPSALSHLFLAEEGRTLLAIEGGVIKKWDCGGGYELGQLRAPDGTPFVLGGSPTLSSDGSHLVLPLAEQVLVVKLDTLEWTNEIAFTGAVSAVFEPSGEAVIISRSERDRIYLYRVVLASGEATALARFRPADRDTKEPAFTQMHFLPDGRFIGINERVSPWEMHLINPSNWSLIRSHKSFGRNAPTVLPDGSLLVLESNGASRFIYRILDPETLQQKHEGSVETDTSNLRKAQVAIRGVDQRRDRIVIQTDRGFFALKLSDWSVAEPDLYGEGIIPGLDRIHLSLWDSETARLYFVATKTAEATTTDHLFVAKYNPLRIERELGKPGLPPAVWLQGPGSETASTVVSPGQAAREVTFSPGGLRSRFLQPEEAPLAFSPDGALKLIRDFGPARGEYRIVSATSQERDPVAIVAYKESRFSELRYSDLHDAAFSPDGKLLALAKMGQVSVYRTDDGSKLWSVRTSERANRIRWGERLRYSGDGKVLYFSGDRREEANDRHFRTVFALAAGNGEILWTYDREEDDFARIVSLDETNNEVGLEYDQLGIAVVLDLRNGEDRRETSLTPATGSPRLVCTLPDDAGVITQAASGVLHWRSSLTTGDAPLASIHLFADDNEWIVATPDLYFDASARAQERLYFRQEDRVIPLSLLYEQAYAPALWKLLRQGTRLAPLHLTVVPQAPSIALTVADFKHRGLTVEDDETALVTESEGVRLRLEARAGSSLLSEIRLFHNGKWVDTQTRGLSVENDSPDLPLDVREIEVLLLPGENRFEAVAVDSARVESLPSHLNLDYQPTVAPIAAGVRLFAVIVGINEYENDRYVLNYAVPDATAFNERLKAGNEALYSEIHSTFLRNGEATREAILAALNEVATAASKTDVFVFYYAGHGVMSGEAKPQFYLIPPEVNQLYGDDRLLAEKAISAATLQEAARRIPAQKQLFLLDACQSAGAIESVMAVRGSAEEKAIALLARSTGTHWLTATGSEQFAAEVETLGHGIFTYALLEAFDGKADNGDGQLTIGELDAFLQSRVPELTREHRGSPQYPASYGFGQDFPLSILSASRS